MKTTGIICGVRSTPHPSSSYRYPREIDDQGRMRKDMTKPVWLHTIEIVAPKAHICQRTPHTRPH